ncbi:MAG TPA: oligosaccharide flippase family protein [Polyangia bacterium]|jgi:stage V sporulation protein B|nr:oligosaccharide flippase family protein [Polyangia bacterium]
MTSPPPSETAPTAAVAPVDGAVEAGRGALFIGMAKVFFMLSGFIQQVVLARIVSPAGYGAFGVVNSTISIVNNTVVQFTVQGVSKLTAEDDRHADAVKRAALKLMAIVGVVLGAGFFLGAPLFAAFEHAPSYVSYYRIAAVIPMLYSVYAVFVGSVNGQRRFRTQAGFDMTFSSAKTVLLLGLAAVAGVNGAFAGFALAAVFIVVVAARVVGLPRASSGAAFPLGRLLAFMATMFGYNFFLNVELLYDQPLLNHFAGLVDHERGAIMAGHYQALRTLALLPYQALLVVTFVIFPLVSRATFTDDRETARAYVTQTLRYAMILATAMGVALGARPSALIAILFPPAYAEGAGALPILVIGECSLALLSVSCAILNASGRATASLVLMIATVAVGVGAAFVLVPRAALGPDMLQAAAIATSMGMVLGFLAALAYVRVRLGGSVPLPTLARLIVAGGAAVAVGHFVPGHGKLVSLVITVLVVVVYAGGLIALGEFGPEDRAKFRRVLRRK